MKLVPSLALAASLAVLAACSQAITEPAPDSGDDPAAEVTKTTDTPTAPATEGTAADTPAETTDTPAAANPAGAAVAATETVVLAVVGMG